MRNLLLTISFLGSSYHGFQVQQNGLSVAEVLQDGIQQVLGRREPIKGCSRTDAGVHAEVYIANFRTDCAIPCDRMPLAFNARLPDDIVVVSAKEVSDKFNAIGSCIKKEYTYRVYNSRIRNAFYVHRAYFYPKILDEQVMAEAAARFVGTHDFKAVRDVGTPTKTTVRTVYYFDVARQGDMIEMKVCANGFLYNMVRAMVGTILYAAEGKLTPEGISDILVRGNRTEAGPTVPPDGLYMTKLWYREPVGLETDPEE